MGSTKQHRVAGMTTAVVVALGVGLGSMVIAATGGGETIKDRLLDANFAADAAAAPAQAITPDCTSSCELWAKSATLTIPGVGSVPVWGYATAADTDPTLPGPTIVVNSGDTVSVTVHNELAGGDLGFQPRSVAVSDRTSAFPLVAPGDSFTYTFEANQVGTSIYGASADSPSGNRQFAMGLSGVLIVRPAECALGDPVVYAGCAYGDPGLPGSPIVGNAGSQGYDVGTDSFNGEALLAMNEIDLAFAADPLGYDMTAYHPTAHLINGRAFPETEVIDAFMGDKVLLRYANLGLSDHSMGLSGSHQRLIGRDAHALPHGSDDVTVPLNVGQTAEAMVAIPVEAKAGFRYALADQVRQPGSKSANGAMTFLTVWGVAADPSRPTTELSMAPGADEISGADPVPFTGTVPTATPAVDMARMSIDDPGVNGIVFPASAPSLSNEVSIATLATLVNGNHILWVELSTDGGTTWGDPAGIAFTIDRAGPVVQPVEADPVYSNGTFDVQFTATADSTLTGTGRVVDGTATIDSCPAVSAQPTGQALTSNGPAAIVELSGTVPAATLGLLTDGEHTINVAAQDNRDVWSNTGDGVTPLCGTVTIVIDRTAPTVTAGAVTPNNNDGTMAFPTVDTYLEVVRITATVDDPGAGAAGIGQVEGFLDDGFQLQPVPADYGKGFRFTPVDGNFDSAHELVYADIPLAAVAGLTPGPHSIWIHGQDLAGNWGTTAAAAATLTVVNGAPVVDTLFLDPNNGDVAVTAGANGVGVTIQGYEYTVGPSAPAAGSGTTQVTIPVANRTAVLSTVLTGITIGTSDNLWFRVQDSTGKWSAAVNARPAVTSLAVTNQRRRLQATAIAPPAATITALEWSTGAAPAAAGSGNAITVNGPAQLVNVTVNRNTAFGAPGTKVWVRARDNSGRWGPAVSVTL